MQLNYSVLIVDDVGENIQVAMNILKEDSYDLSFATSGAAALKLVNARKFDLILLDIMMPGMSGLEVCEQIRNDPQNSDIPIIFLTAKADIDSVAEGFKVGGVDYIIKPFHAVELLARARTHLELHAAKQVLQRHNLTLQARVNRTEQRLLSELESTQMEMIHILTELMESTSDETGKHIRRVAEYSRLLAQYHPSLSEEDARTIFHASPMHDIGKVLIPERILHKAGRFTEEEFEVMKTHTTKAHKFLCSSNRRILKAADIIAHEHHEKWDGSGYPRGLAGDKIHLYGRIVALADVFDALMHKRVYKEAWTLEATVDYIISHRGSHFDPELVDIFKEHLNEFIEISRI